MVRICLSALVFIVSLAAQPSAAEPTLSAESEAGLALAKAQGLFIIRCQLPPTMEEPGMPWEYGYVDGGVLVGAVSTPRGSAFLQPAPATDHVLLSDPEGFRARHRRREEHLGRVSWADASTDSAGSCVFGDGLTPTGQPETVVVSGRIEGTLYTDDGRLRWLNGCGAGSTPVNPDGTFRLTLVKQGWCTLEVGTSGFPEFGTRLELIEDLDGVVVPVPPSQVQGDTLIVYKKKAEAERLRGEIAEYAAGSDVFTSLLSSVSKEAGAVLGGWRADALKDAWQELRRAEETVVFFQDAEARTRAAAESQDP